MKRSRIKDTSIEYRYFIRSISGQVSPLLNSRFTRVYRLPGISVLKKKFPKINLTVLVTTVKATNIFANRSSTIKDQEYEKVVIEKKGLFHGPYVNLKHCDLPNIIQEEKRTTRIWIF